MQSPKLRIHDGINIGFRNNLGSDKLYSSLASKQQGKLILIRN